ncbi:hypothetical protein [Paraburkholderia sediminicola]|uniref:hypothetical protein n=1 Tax=Paraburkholderia sediminicola TaxID=458836 RepID=UPI0038BB23ED
MIESIADTNCAISRNAILKTDEKPRTLQSILETVKFDVPETVTAARKAITKMTVLDKILDLLVHLGKKAEALDTIATIVLCQKARQWKDGGNVFDQRCALTDTHLIAAQFKLVSLLSARGLASMEWSQVESGEDTKVHFAIDGAKKSGEQSASEMPVLQFIHEAKWDHLDPQTQLRLYACRDCLAALASATASTHGVVVLEPNLLEACRRALNVVSRDPEARGILPEGIGFNDKCFLLIKLGIQNEDEHSQDTLCRLFGVSASDVIQFETDRRALLAEYQHTTRRLRT